MTLRVNLEHLVTSVAQITGHGEDLATSHLSVDNRIADAEGGWTGRSAEALARRTPQWSQNSTTLVTQISNHADQFSACGRTFAAMETRHARQLQSLIDTE